MILLCGIPSESPLARVRAALDSIGASYVLLNQRRFAEMAVDFVVRRKGEVTGRLRIGSETYRLEDFQGAYIRLMDDRALPELVGEPEGSRLRTHCRNLHDTLHQWQEIAPCRVVNRSSAMGSNSSKPYQAQIIQAHGLMVPETLVTNNPELVRAFQAKHERIIYKSISSVRSIVHLVTEADLARLDEIRWCPVQFQQFIAGTDVRVHVVGDEVFATEIPTDASDYRYATRLGHDDPELRETEIPSDVADKCVELTHSLGLAFAGIDLKFTPRQEIYCFEVNPSPAFSYFEANTGQPIAEAVARYLTGTQTSSEFWKASDGSAYYINSTGGISLRSRRRAAGLTGALSANIGRSLE